MQETSNIIDVIEDTFSACNICKSRIFEEINKGTALVQWFTEKNTSNEGLVFEALEFFVNEFWQFDPKPPNHMSDKAISTIDKYLKVLYVGRGA